MEENWRKSSSEAYQSGINNYKSGQDKKAIADFDEAICLDPDNATGYHPYIYYWRGQANYHLRQHQDAIADFDEAIGLVITHIFTIGKVKTSFVVQIPQVTLTQSAGVSGYTEAYQR